MAQGRAVVVQRGPASLDALGEAWDGLLARSGADPLFNSREWLTAWWNQYGPAIGGVLDIRAVHAGGSLVGLGLIFRREVKHRGGLLGTRLELLGTARGMPGVAFSEHTQFILDTEFRQAAADALVEDLASDGTWDELHVSYTSEGSVTHEIFSQLAERSGSYLRVVDGMEGWELPLERGFDSLLASLGAGTRARLMGSRKRLEQAGGFEERILSLDEVDAAWDVFSRFHLERWGRPFSDHWQQFYGTLVSQQIRRGIPAMSMLIFDGRPISLLVNLRAGVREYSIAAGFEPVDVKRVSPGWLHFGLALERACDDGLKVFDFLGGEGKNEQYKAAFGGESKRLVCLQLIRATRLKLSYEAWDKLQQVRRRLGTAWR